MNTKPASADKLPTTEELADQFAAQAVKSALKPARDGLQVFDHLAQKPRADSAKPTLRNAGRPGSGER